MGALLSPSIYGKIMAITGIAIGGLIAGGLSERYGLTLPSIKAVRGQMSKNEQIRQRAYVLAREILIREEGKRNDVYLDSRGIPTVGIGHKVLPIDKLKVGDVIPDARVFSLFNSDIASAFAAAENQAIELGKYTPAMIARLTSVNFQLGIYWRTKFPNTWSLMKNGRVEDAIKALQRSAWYKQTPNRVTAFINTIRGELA